MPRLGGWKKLKKNEESIKIKVNSMREYNDGDEALVDFGKQIFKDSLTRTIEYGKTMITLISGFFAIYFALLKFLGASDLSTSASALLPNLWYAPVFFILSIIVFVVGVVLPFPQSISLNSITSLRSARRNLVWVKYISSLVATGLFVYGLWITIQIGNFLLQAAQ
jgi:hypothetical protein